MPEIATRREFTVDRVNTLREELRHLKEHLGDFACVYATGSYGRCEASKYSDLDLFIVGKTLVTKSSDGRTRNSRSLSQIREIEVKAQLIKVARNFGFPEFSKDGKYLKFYSVHDFLDTLGTEDDDKENTFTARLLLLMESCALTEDGVCGVYKEIAEQVIDKYWKDYHDHKNDFMPAFFTNDIIRLWRTFCVNYEARTKDGTPEEKAERKMKNYKLKHSRIMTCFSSILYLLAAYKKRGTVTADDAFNMFSLEPTRRIEHLIQDDEISLARSALQMALEQYEAFLSTTNIPEQQLANQFLNEKRHAELTAAGNKFGDLISQALYEIGKNSDFYRTLIV